MIFADLCFENQHGSGLACLCASMFVSGVQLYTADMPIISIYFGESIESALLAYREQEPLCRGCVKTRS